MAIKIRCFIALVVFLQACAPSRFVKPLKKGERAASFSFGGALIRYAGAAMPIPFTTLGYAKGVADKTTVFGNLHSTSLLFGNLQADIGTTISLLPTEKRFGVSVTPALQTAFHLQDKTSFRIWPSADLNAYYTLKNSASYVFGGLSSWFELSKYKAHDQVQQKHVIPNLQAGFVMARTKWQHQVELKYLGIGIPNLPGVVDYIGIKGKGAIGLYYSVSRKF